ncbi:uncharacterized protein LOC131666623 [Phymastichus coffea]|uniref:uncharacterized protein LOC131666623 n=1 Tax=Phymastichus coffea TaxID=108790 RepID=UPI00273CA82C|nr:uncharacterized protein LOC131666623 [Phymastichus coffea]XP_058795452.1 uncharacterized protein LOC131666623 [Phymastichus coffea]
MSRPGRFARSPKLAIKPGIKHVVQSAKSPPNNVKHKNVGSTPKQYNAKNIMPSNFPDNSPRNDLSSNQPSSNVNFVAIRLCVGKGEIEIKTVTDIKNFDPNRRVPYKAYIMTDLDEDDNKESLQKKRYTKPNVRRSDVIRELAAEEMKAQKHSQSTTQLENKRDADQRKTRNVFPLPSPKNIDDALKDAAITATSMTKLAFENVEATENDAFKALQEKDIIIAQLRAALQDKTHADSALIDNNLMTPTHGAKQRNFISNTLFFTPRRSLRRRITPINPEKAPVSTALLKNSAASTCSNNVVTSPPKKKQKLSNKGKSKKESKQNSRYKRKGKPCLYDSDDWESSDTEETKLPKLSLWKEDTKDPKTGLMVKRTMFHLHFNVSVPYIKWKKALKAKSSRAFLRILATPHIWEHATFIKKAVQVERTTSLDVREKFEPKKFEELKRGYAQYLIENRLIDGNPSTIEELKRKLRVLLASSEGNSVFLLTKKERRI